LKPLHRYILILLLLNILLLAAGYLMITVLKLSFPINNIAILSLAFSLIVLMTLAIFLKGQKKGPDSQTMHSLVAISMKFLLELVVALTWFIVAKKISLPSVLIFFVLYLTFTLFSIWVILKTLKNKSL
jgi:hypothetical protein